MLAGMLLHVVVTTKRIDKSANFLTGLNLGDIRRVNVVNDLTILGLLPLVHAKVTPSPTMRPWSKTCPPLVG